MESYLYLSCYDSACLQVSSMVEHLLRMCFLFISSFNFFLQTAVLFSIVAAPFYIPTRKQCVRVMISHHPCQYLLFSDLCLFYNSHPMGVKWYLVVVLVWIPLMANERFTFLSCKLDHTLKNNTGCYISCQSVCSGHTQNTFPTTEESFSAVKDY